MSTSAHIGSAASKISEIVLYTAGSISFQERIFANTNCLDCVSACVRQLGILHPPSYFGIIHKRSNGESWVSPDQLMLDLPSGGKFVVVPKPSTPEEIKQAYFAKINPKPQSYEIQTVRLHFLSFCFRII